MVDRLIGLWVDWFGAARTFLSHGAQVVFAWLREVSGDAAYEKYVARLGPQAALPPDEFYREQLERKYSQPSRCC
ncbi:MAG: CstA-like transporter-associated (seleno)protein [Candidatus Acidiferrales bacterium]